MRVNRLDGIGPARSADGSVLDLINKTGNITIQDFNVVP